jgi:hypothetical protein
MSRVVFTLLVKGDSLRGAADQAKNVLDQFPPMNNAQTHIPAHLGGNEYAVCCVVDWP